MLSNIHLKNLLDVDIHFSKGYYSTDNILVSKGDRVHTTLLAIVIFFGLTYTIISLLQQYHYQAFLSFSCGLSSELSQRSYKGVKHSATTTALTRIL